MNLRILRFCFVSWKDERGQSINYGMGRQVDVMQVHKNTEIQKELTAIKWNSSGTSLQDSTHCSYKVQELLLRLSVTPEKFAGRIIFMSMFNDISWRSKDNKNVERKWSEASILSLQELCRFTIVFMCLRKTKKDRKVEQ